MVEGIILWLIIGAVAGWLAGKIVEGAGFGLIVDIIVGVVGALIGGWLAGALLWTLRQRATFRAIRFSPRLRTQSSVSTFPRAIFTT